MAFIKESVGKDGRNNKEDVAIIVELIFQAHANKPFLTQQAVDGLGKTGRLFSIAVNQAIEEFVRYAAGFYDALKIPEPKRQQLNRAVIFPDDDNYKCLLACAICGNRKPTLEDFDQNPLLKKAFNNAISYLTFKQALASGSFCNDAVNKESTAEKLDEATIDLLRKNLEKLYANQTFKVFIEAVIDALPNEPEANLAHLNAKKFTGTILENFDRVRNAKGYWIDFVEGADAFYKRGKITFNRAVFRPASTIPIIFVVDSKGKPGISRVAAQVKNSPATEALNTTLTLAHELIHAYWSPIDAATDMRHDIMDKATRKVVGRLAIKSSIPFTENGWAYYFTAVLREVCGNIKL